jgi:hypothetical protein
MELLRDFLHRLTGTPVTDRNQIPSSYYDELISGSPETTPILIALRLFSEQINNLNHLEELILSFPEVASEISNAESLLVRLTGIEATSAEIPQQWNDPLVDNNVWTIPTTIVSRIFGEGSIDEVLEQIIARYQASDPLLQRMLALFRRLTGIAAYTEILEDWERPLIENIERSAPIVIISRLLDMSLGDMYSVFQNANLYVDASATETQIAEIFEIPELIPEAEMFEAHISPVESLAGMDIDKVESAVKEWLTIRTDRARPFYNGPEERTRWQSWRRSAAYLSEDEFKAAEIMLLDHEETMDLSDVVGDQLLENPFANYSDLENVLITFEHQMGVEPPFYGGTVKEWLKNTHPSTSLEELCGALTALEYNDINKYEGGSSDVVNPELFGAVIKVLDGQCGKRVQKISGKIAQVPQNWQQLSVWKEELGQIHKPLVVMYAPSTIKEYKDFRGNHPIFNYVDIVFCNVGNHTAHKGWRTLPDVKKLEELIAPYGGRKPDLILITKRISARDLPEDDKKRPRTANRANAKWITDNVAALVQKRGWAPIQVIKANYPREAQVPWLQEILNIVG